MNTCNHPIMSVPLLTPFKKSFSVENGHLITMAIRENSVLGISAREGPDWERLSQGATVGRATSPSKGRDGLCLCPQAKKSRGSV